MDGELLQSPRPIPRMPAWFSLLPGEAVDARTAGQKEEVQHLCVDQENWAPAARDRYRTHSRGSDHGSRRHHRPERARVRPLVDTALNAMASCGEAKFSRTCAEPHKVKSNRDLWSPASAGDTPWAAAFQSEVPDGKYVMQPRSSSGTANAERRQLCQGPLASLVQVEDQSSPPTTQEEQQETEPGEHIVQVLSPELTESLPAPMDLPKKVDNKPSVVRTLSFRGALSGQGAFSPSAQGPGPEGTELSNSMLDCPSGPTPLSSLEPEHSGWDEILKQVLETSRMLCSPQEALQIMQTFEAEITPRGHSDPLGFATTGTKLEQEQDCELGTYALPGAGSAANTEKPDATAGSLAQHQQAMADARGRSLDCGHLEFGDNPKLSAHGNAGSQLPANPAASGPADTGRALYPQWEPQKIRAPAILLTPSGSGNLGAEENPEASGNSSVSIGTQTPAAWPWFGGQNPWLVEPEAGKTQQEVHEAIHKECTEVVRTVHNYYAALEEKLLASQGRAQAEMLELQHLCSPHTRLAGEADKHMLQADAQCHIHQQSTVLEEGMLTIAREKYRQVDRGKLATPSVCQVQPPASASALEPAVEEFLLALEIGAEHADEELGDAKDGHSGAQTAIDRVSIGVEIVADSVSPLDPSGVAGLVGARELPCNAGCSESQARNRSAAAEEAARRFLSREAMQGAFPMEGSSGPGVHPGRRTSATLRPPMPATFAVGTPAGQVPPVLLDDTPSPSINHSQQGLSKHTEIAWPPPACSTTVQLTPAPSHLVPSKLLQSPVLEESLIDEVCTASPLLQQSPDRKRNLGPPRPGKSTEVGCGHQSCTLLGEGQGGHNFLRPLIDDNRDTAEAGGAGAGDSGTCMAPAGICLVDMDCTKGQMESHTLSAEHNPSRTALHASTQGLILVEQVRGSTGLATRAQGVQSFQEKPDDVDSPLPQRPPAVVPQGSQDEAEHAWRSQGSPTLGRHDLATEDAWKARLDEVNKLASRILAKFGNGNM